MTTLTTALPLVHGITNRIQFLFIKYCSEVNVWTRQIFGNAQYSYMKDDLSSKQRPSIFAYPLWSEKNSFGYNQTGRILIELHFSLQQQRADLAQNIIQITEDILLINLNQKFTQYMQENDMYGLFWFGKYAKADYSRVYAKESIVKIEFDFNVDLLAYQRGLQSEGFDITSPDEAIYLPAQTLFESIAALNSDQTVAFVTH